jgi:L-rhamnose mutarotase
MQTSKYSITVNAPKDKVYRTMIEKESYQQWTKAFNETSTYEGTWETNSKMYFIGYNKEGKREGMVAEIAEHIPNEFISIRHKGIVDGAIEITEGPAVENWANALEKYTFTENAGITTIVVSLDMAEEYQNMFDTMWEKALQLLKEICEKE